jgi:hypothetical protein
MKTHEVYAHELTHALDHVGEKRRISSHPEWKQIYETEIKNKNEHGLWPISKYASTSPSEAFAEFGRVLYGTTVSDAKFEHVLPKATAFFRKLGYWRTHPGRFAPKGTRELFNKDAKANIGPKDTHGHGDVLLSKSDAEKPPV